MQYFGFRDDEYRSITCILCIVKTNMVIIVHVDAEPINCGREGWGYP